MEPLGWWGTVPGWARAIGLTFAVLDVWLVLSCLKRLRRDGMAPGLRERLAVALGLLPLATVFAAYTYAIPQSMKVEACGACHDMEPFVADLRDPKSNNLAALHHQNNIARGEECYACHSDYGLWGDVHAKFEGLGHIWHQATGTYTLPIKIHKPYPNARCLCGSSQSGKQFFHGTINLQ